MAIKQWLSRRILNSPPEATVATFFISLICSQWLARSEDIVAIDDDQLSGEFDDRNLLCSVGDVDFARSLRFGQAGAFG